MDPVIQMVLMIALLFLLGALGEWIFARTGIPDMIWLVAAGIVVGPVFKLVTPQFLLPILPFFGAIALISILMGGGLKFRIADIASAAPRASILGIVGFIMTVLAVCLYGFAMTKLGYVKPHPLEIWIMIGSIIGGTSSLVIIPTMAGGKTDSRVACILEVESCVTDGLCVVVTVVMIDIILRGVFSFGAPVFALGQAMGVGVALGAAGGWIFIPMLQLLRGKVHSYTILLAGFLIVYGVTQLAGGNGAIGVLTCALLIGNAPDLLPRLNHRLKAEDFSYDLNATTIHTQLSFFIKSFFFFLIGLMFPTSFQQILIGAGGAVVLLLARIPAVRLSMWKTPFTLSQQGVMMVAIPRGLAAGVLSTMPMYMGIPSAENLVPIVFATIVFSILIFSTGFMLFGRHSLGSPETKVSMQQTGSIVGPNR